MSSLRFGACAILLVLAGCLEPGATTCADGRVCPAGTACDDVHALCVGPQQLDACSISDPDGTPCHLNDTGGRGECEHQVCLPYGCGNHILDRSEECDGEVPVGKASCLDAGYYRSDGRVSCTAACTFDTSACTGPRCGDGFLDRAWGEECDGVAREYWDCDQLGFYDSRPLVCNPDTCRFDRSKCTGFCGDGTIDGPEQCERAAGWQGPDACVDRGYDFGALACSQVCVASDDGCGHIGWQRVGTAPGAIHSLAAVGTDGVMVVTGDAASWWDGVSWTVVTIGSGVVAVRDTSAGIMAVDESGEFYFWQASGREWVALTPIYAIGVPDQRGFDADAAGVVWVINATHLLARAPGDLDWTIKATYGGAGPRALWVSPAGGAWVGTDDGVVDHGGVRTSLGGGAVQAIWGTRDDDVFVGQDGVVSHWDGTRWTSTPLPITTVAAIRGSSSRNVWVSGRDGALARWDGRAWLRIDAPPGADGPLAVVGGDAWTAGATVWRWQGRGWSSGPILAAWPAGATGVLALAGTDETNLWLDLAFADGTAQIYRFDGAALTWVGPGRFRDGWGTGPSFMYLAGDDGLLLNGRSLDPPMGGDLVAGTGPDNVWLFGGFAGSQHYDGTTWGDGAGLDGRDAWPVATGEIELPPYPYTRVWAASRADIWLGGGPDTLTHRVIGVDTVMPAWQTHGLALAALRGSGPDDVWAVGATGVILHDDGRTWAPVRGPTQAEDLIGLLVTPGRVFFASAAGLYALDRPTPLTCAARERRCGDGVDDDCDGKVDLDDPDCKTAVRLAQVAGGPDRFFEIAEVTPDDAPASLDGLSLAWQQTCDPAPRRYTFPAAAMISLGQPVRAVVDRHVGAREHWIDTPACSGDDRSGWFALCAGPCDLAHCANVIDYVAQGTPAAPPACAQMSPGPVDLHGAGPGDSLHRVGHAGAGPIGQSSDWTVLPATRN